LSQTRTQRQHKEDNYQYFYNLINISFVLDFILIRRDFVKLPTNPNCRSPSLRVNSNSESDQTNRRQISTTGHSIVVFCPNPPSNLKYVYFSFLKCNFFNQSIAFLNPNDPNKPKPTFTFGQSSAFGSTTNPSAPGQSTTPQQQQQQQQQQQHQQSAFGLLNTPVGSSSTGGGAFGQPQQQTGGFGLSTGAFGQPQQQTSGFGQPSGFGANAGGTASAPTSSGGLFGTSGATNKPSLFGAGLTNPPSAFGGGTSGFVGIALFLKELTL
jgi:hypothetical protein